MGNTGSAEPTPEDRARKLPRSDFDHHPSLTPVELVQKKPLPGFVPILTVPEGHVHKLPRATAGAFADSVVGLKSKPDEGYVFQPNRTLDHISGRETKIRYVRRFHAPQRQGKLYFLRSRTVERKQDASPEEKLLARLLDEIKSQNKAFKTLEAEQMRQIERALEEMVGVVSEQLRAGNINAAAGTTATVGSGLTVPTRGSSGSILGVRIKNALKSGEALELMNIIVSQWLTKVKDTMVQGEGGGEQSASKWGALKTNILRSKPWVRAAKSPLAQARAQFDQSLGALADDDDGSGDRPSTAEDEDADVNLDDDDDDDVLGLGDTLLGGLGDTLGGGLGDTLGDSLLDSNGGMTRSSLNLLGPTPEVEEERLDLDEFLLEDFLQVSDPPSERVSTHAWWCWCWCWWWGGQHKNDDAQKNVISATSER
jgi:hypothetical protein